MGSINKYKVWFSKYRSVVVNAKSASNARARAWNESDYKYGWSKSDFLRNATTERL